MSIRDTSVEAPSMGVMEAKNRVEEIYRDVYGPNNVSSSSKSGGFAVRSKTVTDKVDIMPHKGGTVFYTGMTQATVESRINSIVQTGAQSADHNVTTEPGNTHNQTSGYSGYSQDETEQTGADMQVGMSDQHDDHPRHGKVEAEMTLYQNGHLHTMYHDDSETHTETAFGVVVNDMGQMDVAWTDDDFSMTEDQIKTACEEIQTMLMEAAMGSRR